MNSTQRLKPIPNAALSRLTYGLTLSFLTLLTACKTPTEVADNQEPDPVVVDLPIAYIQRPLPIDGSGNALTESLFSPADFNPGAALFVKDRATPSAPTLNITAAAFAANSAYDVKDLDVSSDGRRLIFAMRAPEIEGLDDDQQPSWNIWQYNLDDQQLERLITSDISAEAGQDINPAYLADGRIVFSSSRQRRSKAILLDDNKPQFSALDEDRGGAAFVLHAMSADGTDLKQLTFNQSHDLQPSLLSDGRIVFNRWDNIANRSHVSLYTVKPDGSDLSLYYGYHSQNTATDAEQAAFHQPRQLPDGRLLALLKPRTGSRYGGDIIAIDTENYTDINQPTHANSGVAAQGQQSLSVQAVSSDDSLSVHGAFSSVFPFSDGSNRLLVSWSQCRVIEPQTLIYRLCSDELLAIPGIEEAPPLYGLWIYDLDKQSQQPLIPPEEGIMVSEAITLEPAPEANFIPAPVVGIDLDADLVNQGVGTLHIRSVYDIDGSDSIGMATLADPAQTPASDRPARFLRIVKAVSIPDDDVLDFDNSAFGRSAQQLMREIIGYVPIEPDGSVSVRVPADIAFTLSVVDSNGKRISARHQNWLQVRAGETRECSGCHTSTSEMPHGRADAQAPSANVGALTSGSPFPNTRPALFADAGESMAQTWSRINGVRTPSVNVVFEDQWTDDSGALTKTDGFELNYHDLLTAAPVSSTCQTGWSSLCRTIINFEEHIQPLWNLPREIIDINGNTIEDHTCSRCHSTRDNNNALQLPAAQLDLSGAASSDEADHFIAYRELLFGDVEQELDSNGVLIDRLVQATDNSGQLRFATDELGNLLLDIDGNAIPIMETVPIASSMRTSGAHASQRFFAPFASGASHADYLSPAEHRLIAEWLDIGAQYYNNPFDVPIN